MQLNVEVSHQKKSNIVSLEKSLIQAKTLGCGEFLVRSLLRCIRINYGRLEEHRIITQYQLGDFVER